MSYTKTEWIDNVTIVDAAKLNKIEDQLETLDTQKVSRDGNKGLSSNDFTDAYKTKLDNLEDTISTSTEDKVDKEDGKGLSSNDFTTEYKSKVDLIDGIQKKVDRLERASDVIEITAVDGNITLETNKIYRTNISSDTNIILPTIDDSTFSQILVQADVSDGVNIDFGTEYYFGSGYQGDAGKYNFIFEHNGSDWVYGALYTGGQ